MIQRWYSKINRGVLCLCVSIILGCFFNTYYNIVLGNNSKQEVVYTINPDCIRGFSDTDSRFLTLLSLDGTVKLDSTFLPDFYSVDSRYFTKVITRYKRLAQTIIKELKVEKNLTFDNVIKKIDKMVWFRLRLATIIEFLDMKPEKKDRLLIRLMEEFVFFLMDNTVKEAIWNYNPGVDNLTEYQKELVTYYKQFSSINVVDINGNESEDEESLSRRDELSDKIAEKYFEIEEMLNLFPISMETDFTVRSIANHDINKEQIYDLFTVRKNRVYVKLDDVSTILSKLHSTFGRRRLYEGYNLHLQSNAKPIYKELVKISTMYKQLIEEGDYNPDSFFSSEHVKKLLESRIQTLSDKLLDSEEDMYRFIREHFTSVNNQSLIELDPWNMYYYNEWYNESQRQSKRYGSKLGSYLHYDKVLDNILGIFFFFFGVEVKEVSSNKYYKLFKDSNIFEVSKDGKLIMVLHISKNTDTKFDLTASDSYPYTMFINHRGRSFESLPVVAAVDFKLDISKRHDSVCGFEDVVTMFHELGHAFGTLILDPIYSSFYKENKDNYSGIGEYQSMFMEVFATEPDIIRMYAKHYITGQSMSDQQIESFLYSGRSSLVKHLSGLVIDYIDILIQRGEFTGIDELYSKFKLTRYVQDECNLKTRLYTLIKGESRPLLYSYDIGLYLGADLLSRMRAKAIFSKESVELMRSFFNFYRFKNFEEFLKDYGQEPSWKEFSRDFKFFK